jgi:hypothetical protein
MEMGLFRFMLLLALVAIPPALAQTDVVAPELSGLQVAATDRFIEVAIDDQVGDGCWTNPPEVQQTMIDRFNRFGIDAGTAFPQPMDDYWGGATLTFLALGERTSGGACLVSWMAELSYLTYYTSTVYNTFGPVAVYTTMGYSLGSGARNADLDRAADNVAAELSIAMQEFRRSDEYGAVRQLIQRYVAANDD